MKALGLWSHAFLRQNDPLINGEKISSRKEKQRRLHFQFFGSIVIAFGMLIHCPAVLMVCIVMRLELDISYRITLSCKNGRALLSQVEGGRGGGRTSCWLRLPASVLLNMPFEPGWNTCLGLQKQHMVMLCKTKGHVKADVALFKSLQGHEEKKETKVISGLISRPKNLLRRMLLERLCRGTRRRITLNFMD